MKIKLEDTIVAIATAIAKQAISILRLSGQDSFNIVNKILKQELNVNNKMQLRKLYENDELIDEALVLTFEGKKSFTGENSVEIHCHGGILVVNKILSLLLKNGARLAKPGEFSQRAFLNGKIDILQAESINNLIESKNELALKLNAKGLEGKNNKLIIKLKDKLIDIISKIQTSIDYPDYDDVEGSSEEEIKQELIDLKLMFEDIYKTSQRAIIINQGIKTAIIGNTNVGKSTLLNSLINEQKAIVTDIEGTTRDFVEGILNFKTYTLNLIDTAGIRKTKDVVENIGIQKSLDLIEQADLIFYVINDDKYDLEIFNRIKQKNYLVILNKIDLIDKSIIDKLETEFKNLIKISASNNNLKELFDYLEEKLDNSDILNKDLPILTKLENINQLELIINFLNESIDNINFGHSIDVININLYEILKIINEMLGIVDYDEEVIDNIFRKYCLGK